jgi:hypothetical protein
MSKENQAPTQEEKKPESKELANITEGKKMVRSDDPNAIFSPDGLQVALNVCNQFLKSGSLPQSYKTPQSVLIAVQAGRELGMKPMESINGMMIINGQVKLWGTALTGRVTNLGYKIKWGECTAEKASVSIVDPEGEETGVETYTIEEAKGANLLGKTNWKGHAKTMLRWRALGNAVKFNFPHLLQGYSLAEDDDTVDTVDTMQGEVVVEQEDNASKLLKKTEEKKEEPAPLAEEKKEPETVEGEVVETEAPAEEEKPAEAEPEKKEDYIPENVVRELEALMEEVGTKVETVEQFFKTKLRVFTVKQGEQLKETLLEKKKVLNEKKAKEEEKARGGNHLPPVKPDEGPAAKAVRAASAKAKANAKPAPASIKESEVGDGLPGDVCQYLNAIEGVDDVDLPSDIVMLKLDAGRAMFKGYTAYPSLADEMARVKAETEAPAETQAPAPPAGKVEDVTMDVLEVVNELAAKDPTELSDDDKKLIEDCNKNQFLGKASYPGVKFQ